MYYRPSKRGHQEPEVPAEEVEELRQNHATKVVNHVAHHGKKEDQPDREERVVVTPGATQAVDDADYETRDVFEAQHSPSVHRFFKRKQSKTGDLRRFSGPRQINVLFCHWLSDEG
jgi:hypothetical protein